MPGDSPKPYLWMLLGSFCFAWMGTFAHWAGYYYPWEFVAIGRSVIPLVLVAAWALAIGVPLIFRGSGILWMRSVSGSISLICTFYALTKLPAAEVFTVTNTFPIWVAILSWPMLGELPTASVWFSVACSVGGIYLINGDAVSFDLNPTILVALIASVSTAFAMIGLHRLKHIDTRAVVVHFSMTALAFATASYFIFERPTPENAPTDWSLVLVVAVGLSATLGQLFLTKAFTHGHPAKVSVVNLAQIPFTLLLGVLFFGHSFTGRKLYGMALVLGPTAWLLWSQRPGKPPAVASEEW